MDKTYYYVKSSVVNFKLDTCCCFAPIRVGVLIIAYFNLFMAMLCLIGTADGGVQPPLMVVQEMFLEDQQSKSVGLVAYTSELAFSIVLLCGLYRNDTVLLRVFIYFEVAVIVGSFLVYSMVIVAVSSITKCIIIGNMVYNGYVILLARSVIVDIRESQTSEKNGHVVLYSVAPVPKHEDEKKVPDVEAPVESIDNKEANDKKVETEDIKEDEKPETITIKLEPVPENPQEERIER